MAKQKRGINPEWGKVAQELRGGNEKKETTKRETETTTPKGEGKNDTPPGKTITRGEKVRRGTVTIGEVQGYNLQGAAAVLGCSEYTVRMYIKNKKLQAQKIRGRIFISQRNLNRFLHGEKPEEKEN